MNLFDFEKVSVNKPIRLIELFAGYGSQALALKYLGVEFEHHFVCEFDKYAVASYNAVHNTNFNVTDIRDIHAKDLNIVDTDKYDYIMTYSFPCTDLSIAGKQAIETLTENDCEQGDVINAFNKSVDKSGISPTLTTRPEGFKTSILPVISKYRIRKLTPRECFRLMGVKDEDSEKMLSVNSNSQCYKQAGNSIVVPVLMALFSQMNIKGCKAWNERY